MEVKELEKAVSKLVRVTKNGGGIVVSVQHPALTAGDWERESGQKLFRKLDDYFGKKVGSNMGGRGKRTILFQVLPQSLQDYTQPFLERGCVLTYLVEPRPHEAYKILNPKEYGDARRIPHFMILKFRKVTNQKRLVPRVKPF
jgi:hypothetical protein